MKRHITREKLFGPTPDSFTQRLKNTLNQIEEDKPVKKSFSVPILALVLVLLLAGVALAAMRGLPWYYENRFDYGGKLPQDVAQRIQTDLNQRGDHPLAHVTVTGVAWLGNAMWETEDVVETLDVNIRAAVKDEDTYEMVGAMSIDVDGARGGQERREHPQYGSRANEPWLWAYGKHGPLDQVMKDPTKQLLLFSGMKDERLQVDGEAVRVGDHSFDILVDDEAGEVVCQYSFPLSQAEMATLRAHANEEGYVTFTIESVAQAFGDNGETQPVTAVFTFEVKLP